MVDVNEYEYLRCLQLCFEAGGSIRGRCSNFAGLVGAACRKPSGLLEKINYEKDSLVFRLKHEHCSEKGLSKTQEGDANGVMGQTS